MKTKYFIFAASALVALASCSNDEYIGDNNGLTAAENDGSINFGGGFKAITRADHVGADAAALLNNKFIVGGFKGDGSTMTEVFDNYIVQWTANTAGKTASNTSDWEYVGITAAAPSEVTGTQTIKYWDYSASQYDFAAYSTGDLTVATTGDATSGTVVVSGVNVASPYAGPVFSIKGLSADLAKCYISDLVTAYQPADYQKEVQLTFRNLATKVRIALYETIPGYSVKDVKFYTNNTTTLETGTSETSATLFAPNDAASDVFYAQGTATINYPTIGSTNKGKSDYNKAHVTFAPLAEGGSTETKAFGNLNYTTSEDARLLGSIYLARTSTAPTFAGNAGDNYYATVLPNETGTVLELRVDYTLVSNDGHGETITIHGATAYVPLIYATWKPNYAYTYIFKISDNTNGWTSTVATDPAGLYPITFDAVVVDAQEHTQSTITTVATPSITTYQKGHDYSAHETYDAGDIYVQVMTGTTLENDLNTKGYLYTLSDGNATEASVMDAISIQAYSVANPPATIEGRNGLTLTNAASAVTLTGITAIPGVDGNDITVANNTAAKITAAASTTYAFIYDTDEYNGIYLAEAPAGWPTGYFTDNTLSTPATAPFAAGTFYKSTSEIRSYMELSAKPADWNNTTNVYYSDEDCTSMITGEYANPAGASYTEQPADWPRNYYNDAAFNTPSTTWSSGVTYYRKHACYKKFTVNNKIYGVKVIKVN